MKLIEISALILILPLCLKEFSCGVSSFFKMQEKLLPLEKNFQRDFFIFSSFKNLCVRNSENKNHLSEEKISEWKKMCEELFDDENEITVSNVGFSDKKTLLKCEWKTCEKFNQVYFALTSN